MRRGAIVAAIFVMALGVVGCAGIPMSGPVEDGIEIDAEVAPDFGFLPPGPQPGADQAGILAGFIQAATSPQDDYAIAREFLAESIRGKWEPNAITQIRIGAGSATESTDGTMNYTFSTTAHVDSTGRYFQDDQATQSLPFSFVQDDDGEWRISAAEDGTVLSSDGFNTIFAEHPLYFYDLTGAYLVPDMRYFSRTTLLPTREVNALLTGQASWLGNGVTNTFFPTGTTLEARVTLDAGVATVDLSEEALAAEPQGRAAMREQLKSTIGVSDVIITVNSVAIDVPDLDRIPSINPTPAAAMLAQVDDSYGFLTDDGAVTGLPGQSDEVVGLGATDATLSRDRKISAVLAPDGVHIVFSNDGAELLIDNRASLTAPSVDASNFVWSIPSNDGSAIVAFDVDGKPNPVASSIAPGTNVVSFAISRDGSRALFYVRTEVGPELFVAGILRKEGAPYALGELLSLRVEQALQPLDAAWVDDHTVATLAGQGATGFSVVTTYDLGGTSSTTGRVPAGQRLAGGPGHTDGLRVTNEGGEVFQPRGSGWATTNAKVTFMGTQQ